MRRTIRHYMLNCSEINGIKVDRKLDKYVDLQWVVTQQNFIHCFFINACKAHNKFTGEQNKLKCCKKILHFFFTIKENRHQKLTTSTLLDPKFLQRPPSHRSITSSISESSSIATVDQQSDASTEPLIEEPESFDTDTENICEPEQ